MAAPSAPGEFRPAHPRRLARLTFVSFLLTFIASRSLVILIMARKVPDLFLHLGGTHVHHLNYGIFLLTALSGVLLFARLNEKQMIVCAIVYGFASALTFDEFGMWLHLGGSYWQRASFDAVIVVLSIFGVLAFAPPFSRLRSLHLITGAALLLIVVGFYVLLFRSLTLAGNRLYPRLKDLEEQGPR